MSDGPTIALPASQLPSFFADLRFLVDPAHRDLVQKTLEALGTYTGTGSEVGQSRMETELAASVSVEPWTVRRAFQMLAVLNVNLAAEVEGTTPTQAATKLIEILQRTAGDKKELQLSTEELGSLQTLFNTVAEGGGRVKQDAVDQSIVRGILPMFEDLKATLELRSLQWPLVSDADMEQPFKLVPIASLSLQLDSGNPSTTCFQATEADLASMLNKLQRLQAALLKLKQTAAAISPIADAQNIA